VTDWSLAKRRQFLATAAVAGTGALAGCPSDSGGAGTDTATDGGGETNASEATGTPTPNEQLPGKRLECGTQIPARITEDTALKRDCTYTVEQNSGPSIQEGATLYVEPGVEVEVAQKTGITANDGAISAQGTEDNPIEFRGEESAPGYWNGIEIRATTPDNEFRHVTITDAGDGYWNAALAVHRGDPEQQAVVRNCTMRNSSTSGVMADGNGTLVDFRDNRIEDCQGAPIRLHAERLTELTGTTTFANVGESYVLVEGNFEEIQKVDTGGTWPTMDLPYRVTASPRIRAEVDIEVGTSLEFPEGDPWGLFVTEGGRLVADAGDGDAITFRGVEGTPGEWRGIFVRTTNDNVLSNVVVSDAGGGYRGANIGVGIDDPGKLTVTDSAISDSAGWGIILQDGELSTEKNTYSNNAEGDVKQPDN